jgi:hypothetical protein
LRSLTPHVSQLALKFYGRSEDCNRIEPTCEQVSHLVTQRRLDSPDPAVKHCSLVTLGLSLVTSYAQRGLGQRHESFPISEKCDDLRPDHSLYRIGIDAVAIATSKSAA